jgi:hypothetical protein
MPESLAELEGRREKLYAKMRALGDFRRGSISVNYRKCGKPNCQCAQEGHPGHGPRYLWSTTIKGKSYTRNIQLGPEMKKYEDEIARYHSFLNLCEEVLEVTERICDMRPIVFPQDKTELEELKKKLQKKFKERYKTK